MAEKTVKALPLVPQQYDPVNESINRRTIEQAIQDVNSEIGHVKDMQESGISKAVKRHIFLLMGASHCCFNGGSISMMLTALSGIKLPDNEKIFFGDGNDLEIYHDGSNSFIQDAGTGTLRILSDDVRIMNAAGTEISAQFLQDGEARLKYDNSTKLATKSTGIDVTGVLAVNSGTTDTAATFTSSDTAVAVNFVASDNSMQIATSGTDGIIKNNGAGSFRLFNNGSERARIDSSGNLGLGTSLPSAKLHVEGGSVSNTAKFIIGGSDAIVKLGTGQSSFGGPHGLQFDYASGQSDGMSMYYRTTPRAISFEDSTGVSGNKVMVIEQDGNVGIGTDSPNYLLSLQDNDGADLGFSNSSALSDGDYLGRIYGTDSSNNFFTGINMLYHDSNDGEMRFRIKTAGTNTDVMTLVDGGVTVASTSPGITIEDTDANSTYNKIELQNAGASLNLNTRQSNGTFVSTDYQIIKNAAGANIHKWFIGGSEKLRLDSSGRLGINTTSLDAPLTIHNSSDPEIRVGYNSSQDHRITWDSAKLFLDADPDNANSNSILGFRVDGTERLRIQNTGGISFNGDTAAANALDDYEEGTFTLTTAGDSSGAFNGTPSCHYTKIGNMVTVLIAFRVGTNFSSNLVGGLPFTTSHSGMQSSFINTGQAITSTSNTISTTAGNSGTTIRLHNNQSTGDSHNPNTTAEYYRLNFTYKAA